MSFLLVSFLYCNVEGAYEKREKGALDGIVATLLLELLAALLALNYCNGTVI
jgi:hypothetical protein